MSGARFTAWFSEDERTALRNAARRHKCSENFVLRIALRSVLFDENVPAHMRGNTGNTNNAQQGAQS